VVHCGKDAMVGKLKWTAVYIGRWQHPLPLPPLFSHHLLLRIN
jgi:hypothetical protein